MKMTLHSFSLLYKYAAVWVAVENMLKAVGSARHVEPAEELRKDLPIFSLLHKQGCELKDAEQWNVPVPCITGLLLLPAHCQGLTSEHKLPYLLWLVKLKKDRCWKRKRLLFVSRSNAEVFLDSLFSRTTSTQMTTGALVCPNPYGWELSIVSSSSLLMAHTLLKLSMVRKPLCFPS